MGKITITRDMDRALNTLLGVYSKEFLMTLKVQGDQSFSYYLKDLSIEEFAKILFEGYEVEEDKKKALLDTYLREVRPEYREFDRGVRYGIKLTLDTFDIELD